MTSLSRIVSHALRHEPWLYELELDSEGWVDVDDLLSALAQQGIIVEPADLTAMIEQSSKKRHEIRGTRIRALYGHSLPGKLARIEQEPPEVLFHGTSPEAKEIILSEGIKPMNRQYVHLSVDKDTAFEVGRRKSKSPCLLRVFSKNAYQNGHPFYRGNDKVWLADEIPPQYITINF